MALCFIRMEQKKLSICIFLCMMTHQAYAICDLQSPFTMILETAPNGTVIFNITKPPGTTPSFTIKSPTQGGVDAALMDRLLLINGNTTFQLINSKVLDLEEFMISYGADIRTIDLMVTCGGTTVDVFVNVAAVNEFPPVFNNAPYNVTLNESLAVGSLVFILRSRVTDADVVGAENYFFAIEKYEFIDFDGAAYFNIQSSSNGDITLFKMLDFDTMERKKLFLNLSVFDDAPSSPTAKTTYTTLEIHVADVDDQPPYFEYPDCPPPCPAPQFLSIIRLAHKGPLPIIPVIRGNDLDSLGTPLVYSILAGNQHNLFIMNPLTGAVNQNVSLNEAGVPVIEFRLIIKVRKDLPSIDLFSIGILRIKVSERITNTSEVSPPSTRNTTTDKGFDLTIPFIVVCILFVIVFVLLIVLFIKYRRQQPDKNTKPADVKTETQSQEGGDCAGNVYEGLNFSNYAVLGNVTGKIQDTPVSNGDL
ncbi:cadherin-99C-like isoform X2 [Ruditapes philippinarum]|uniref:cadherin-99C-like isoform X2 n=1 Tax=Ruditapes philippinarum TaxID=129788 RepID=UPI00295B9529|nr:cadherin-99C-like isoform X2 [Ruditapes philippinarum]XP_060566195.1 cadherin-99C-like isoform X2 [Ruditapes philippinarum]